MSDNVHAYTGLYAGLPQALVAVVTICAAAVVGLVLLHRPDRAAVAWSTAFGLGLLGTYIWVAAIELELPALRALASGLMLCAEPLIWLGLRIFAGRRASWPAAAMFVALVPVMLALTVDSDVFAVFFRVCFAGAGVFAGLIVFDLVRLKCVARDVLLPLMLSSAGFVLVAGLNLVWTLSAPQLDGDGQVAVLRDMNVVGTMVTTVTATLTILLLVRGPSSVGTARSSAADATIRERVERVRAVQEPAWSLLDVRLDDVRDLRESTSAAEFARILARFRSRVLDALPPAADVAFLEDSRLLVLMPGSDEAVTYHLRTLLERVSAMGREEKASTIRISASVGWATILDARFDYEKLIELASERAESAGELGGDRWGRPRRAAVTMAEGEISSR